MANSTLHPLFTIITVTYNAAATVQRTLDSVAEQSCSLYEHLIIDGASTDGTLDIVREAMQRNPLISLLSEPDKGLYDAMNKGIGLAKGDYLIFLNAGDKLHSPDTLQSIADTILDNDYPGIVYGQTDIVDNNGTFISPSPIRTPKKLTAGSFIYGMSVRHQSMFVARKIACEYDLKYHICSDFDWAIRCIKRADSTRYADCIVCDFLGGGISNINAKQCKLETFAIMRKYYGLPLTLIMHAYFILIRGVKLRILYKMDYYRKQRRKSQIQQH
ncbi:MAG: glycosyltransferase family 2 protein [Muribaculaceae bacterium]